MNTDKKPLRNPIDPPLLHRECSRALASHRLSAPTNQELLQQVVGPGGTAAGYLYGGFTVSLGVRAALQLIGRQTDGFSSILDFGCGSGRVIRWFQDLLPNARLNGSDISESAIAWCRENLEFGTFVHNGPLPPLPFPDASMDLVIGVSVFTHLNEDYQLAWLAELQRITAPGGILLLTVHPEDKAEKDLRGEIANEFQQNGFLYRKANELTSVQGLPEFYQVAYHSQLYVRRVWSRFFKVLGFVLHGPNYSQEMVLVQKSEKSAATDEPFVLNLPMCSLDEPILGARSVSLKGWAFDPLGSATQLRFWLDGKDTGCGPTGLPRADVARTFANEHAAFSGFSTELSLQDVAAGDHVLWAALDDVPFPLSARFFTTA